MSRRMPIQPEQVRLEMGLVPEDCKGLHLAQPSLPAGVAALQVGELAPEAVHSRGVHEVGLPRPVQVVGQHVRVVLQDLPVDQLPHLPTRLFLSGFVSDQGTALQ